ncbi:MAG TPA: ABC transporter permease [Candidatus Obscuribacterales bacterium]
MSLWDLVRLAWQSIIANRMRSGLTVLGIIIGIAAVIALLAIGYGVKVESDRQIQALGLNVIFVRAGAARAGHVSMGMGSGSTLTLKDAEAISEVCPAVENVAPGMFSNLQVQYGSQNTNTTVTATVPDYTEVRNFHPASGRFFTDSDLTHSARVCVLGHTVAENLFLGDENPIGKKVMIKGELFDVIGIMEKKGSTAFMDMDDQVFVPLSTAYNRLFGINAARGQTVQYILVQAKSEDQILPAQFQITNLLRLRHKIKPPLSDDFYLRTQQELLQTAQSMSSMFTTLLGCTAGISLLVGGIGIMNIMLVSVTERTREIGIRKAVGARPEDIMWQFVVESIVLSLSGGLVGVLLGIVSSYAVSAATQWTTIVTPWSVVLSFAVSIAVGLFFGIYPAKRASQLDPIIALRTE